jgi:hypothetical protein
MNVRPITHPSTREVAGSRIATLRFVATVYNRNKKWSYDFPRVRGLYCCADIHAICCVLGTPALMDSVLFATYVEVGSTRRACPRCARSQSFIQFRKRFPHSVRYKYHMWCSRWCKQHICSSSALSTYLYTLEMFRILVSLLSNIWGR